jgi:RNA polymerase sigma factor (TIGR02999 family)
MSDVPAILSGLERGDPVATEKLLPLVYDELRELAAARLAREKPGQTLQATALVHEAYLRIAGRGPSQQWDGRGHFFAAAAEAMRRIVIENARRKQSLKGGGGKWHQSLEAEPVFIAAALDPLEVLAIHEALDRLSAKSPRKAELVKLRYFLGCTIPEAADILGIAAATAEEDWTYTKAWLQRELKRAEQKKDHLP